MVSTARKFRDRQGQAVDVSDFVFDVGGAWLAAWLSKEAGGWMAPRRSSSVGVRARHVVRAGRALLIADRNVQLFSRRADAVRYLVNELGWVAQEEPNPSRVMRKIVALNLAGVSDGEIARRVKVSVSYVVTVLELPASAFREVAA